VAHTIRQLVSREGKVCSQREPLQNADGMRFHPGRAVSCTSTYLRLRPNYSFRRVWGWIGYKTSQFLF